MMYNIPPLVSTILPCVSVYLVIVILNRDLLSAHNWTTSVNERGTSLVISTDRYIVHINTVYEYRDN